MQDDVKARNSQLIRALYEDWLSHGRFEELQDSIADDYVGPNGERGAAGFATTMNGLRSAFPDIRFQVEDLIAEPDKVAVRWRWQAIHAGEFRGLEASHRRVENTGIAIYHLRHGKIVRSWLETDRLGALQQIGALPAGVGASPPRSN
ncbi:ester cyclase [Variovorax paradoxus]|jgi:steroid delta-isomerase-like uncharacterized protein|uniref:ester cyclase n=1 Tax=Variovorax paradoxus TaxID=34073 RepID=UPI001DBE4FEE|nr:ester cyclase [Variovorax paradoxus]MBW8718118.1 ester cyclase [Variovorax paradoxus]